MYQLSAARKLSLIHSVKCDKATSFEIALQASDRLRNLLERPVVNESTESFNQDIAAWMETFPIVTDQNIQDLIRK